MNRWARMRAGIGRIVTYGSGAVSDRWHRTSVTTVVDGRKSRFRPLKHMREDIGAERSRTVRKPSETVVICLTQRDTVLLRNQVARTVETSGESGEGGRSRPLRQILSIGCWFPANKKSSLSLRRISPVRWRFSY